MKKVLGVVLAALLLAGCGDGTSDYVSYLENHLVLNSDEPDFDEARYEMIRTGYEMCRLMKDEGFTIDEIVMAYSPNAQVPPDVLVSVAVGAKEQLCDQSDYHKKLPPWDKEAN